MYRSALFHLHSILEGNQASISGYAYEAQRFGVDVVWISDHDGRYFRDKQYIIPLDGAYELRPIEHPDGLSLNKTGDDTPRLSARVRGRRDDWAGMALMLPYVGKPQRPPLMLKPTISLGLDTNIRARSRNRRLTVRLHLSQTPPDHQPVCIDYVFGARADRDDALPLPMDRDGIARIAPFDDVMTLGWTADHNLTGIEILLESRLGADTRLEVSSLVLETEISDPHAILEAQIALAREIGAHQGVTIHVNYEASGDDGHMTCFGPPLPIPYDVEKRLPRREIARRMAERGGVVSINHPFSRWKRETLDEPRKQALLEEVAGQLIHHQAHGARLIEVGFPEGRHNFDVTHYLDLLDRLNMAGLRMAAIGVSDAHGNRPWDQGNNFANYLASPDCRQENLLAALHSGNHYMADPVRVRGQLEICTDQGKTMGDRQSDGTLRTSIDAIPRGSEWRWIADGQCVGREPTAGAHTSQCELSSARRFVRAELWDPYERLILATNPVWCE